MDLFSSLLNSLILFFSNSFLEVKNSFVPILGKADFVLFFSSSKTFFSGLLAFFSVPFVAVKNYFFQINFTVSAFVFAAVFSVFFLFVLSRKIFKKNRLIDRNKNSKIISTKVGKNKKIKKIFSIFFFSDSKNNFLNNFKFGDAGKIFNCVPALILLVIFLATLAYNLPEKYQLANLVKAKSLSSFVETQNFASLQIAADDIAIDNDAARSRNSAGQQMVLAETDVAGDPIAEQIAITPSNKSISLVGMLMDKDGQPANGDFEVRFAIYSADRTEVDVYPSNIDQGKRLWEETRNISIKDGVFHVELGNITSLPVINSLQSNQFYLGMRIGTDSEMFPRKRIATPLFAFNSANAILLNGKKVGVQAGDIVALNESGKINLVNLPTGTKNNQLVLGNDKRLKFTVSGASFVSLSGQKFTIDEVDLAGDVTGILPVANGGTGLSAYTAGDMLYYSSGTAMTKLAIGTNGQVLTISGGVPVWGASATETDPIFIASQAYNITAQNIIDLGNLSGMNTGDQTITLTGDIAGSGTGNFATVLATVNSNIGTFNNLTVNAKGLVTGASNTAYLTSYTETDPIFIAASFGGDVSGTYGAIAIMDDSHNHTSSTVSGLDISADTNLAVSGALLQLTGDTLSVKEGIMTDTRLCTYSTAGGLVCNTSPGAVGLP
ncbi:TPA: hypothetical protein DCL22_01540, partial [Candidatus Moranbacteria bacterium]|nr:hypothetical protein [Candidatus Moranbacteria bacterium]